MECFQNNTGYQIDSEEGPYNSGEEFDGGNIGHRPSVKGGYFPVPPVDSMTDIRAEMVTSMMEMGLPMEKHHHEVAPSQNELGFKFGPMIQKLLIGCKYINIVFIWLHIHMVKQQHLCLNL